MTKIKRTDVELSDLVNAIANDRQSLQQLAEDIIVDVCSTGREFKLNERHIFDSLGWDETDIQRQRGRIDKVIQLKEIAGSQKSLRTLETKLDQKRKKLNPLIDSAMEQIENLENEIDSMRKTISNDANEVRMRKDAQTSLRSLAPKFCHDAKNFETRSVKNLSNARELREAESRLGMINQILGGFSVVNRSTHEQIIHHCRSYLPKRFDLVVRGIKTSHGIREQVDEVEWSRYIGELQAELPKLENRIAELKPIYEKAMLAADRHLDHYI